MRRTPANSADGVLLKFEIEDPYLIFDCDTDTGVLRARTVKKLGLPIESAMMDSPNGEGEHMRTSAGLRVKNHAARQ